MSTQHMTTPAEHASELFSQRCAHNLKEGMRQNQCSFCVAKAFQQVAIYHLHMAHAAICAETNLLSKRLTQQRKACDEVLGRIEKLEQEPGVPL